LAKVPKASTEPGFPAQAVAALIAVVVFLAVTAATVGVASPVSAAAHPTPSPAPAAAHTPAVVPSRPPAPAGPPALISYSSSWVSAHPSPPVNGLQAASAVLIDLDKHQVLWAGSADQPRATASLAKIVTVLVALDLAPLQRVVAVPGTAVDNNPDHTTMGLNAGDQVTVRELLYGVFLVSGNDAAETLAQTLEPRAKFIADMNAKAAALGMRSSHFVNPTGLDAPGHGMSAHDLAHAAAYLETYYPDLATIAGTRSIAIAATSTHKAFYPQNLNRLVGTYPGATGLKTGLTDNAGGCMLATATRDGRHLIAVVMNDTGRSTEDAAALLDYGFSVHPTRAFGPWSGR
jgi:serine-type D-Ala-D-Ala carboxypeptidase (penicillin-binding protein 5/6)